MGKHEKKSKRAKEKHKRKKSKQRSSSSSTSTTEDEWVEKETAGESKKETKNMEETKREDWMSLPTLFATTSNVDRRQEKEAAKSKQKDSSQYDPRSSTRELNPYWKQGGSGLPTNLKSKNFVKPCDDNNYTYKSNSSRSNWRKNKTESSLSKSDEPIAKPSNSESKEKSLDHSEILSDKELNEIAAKIIKAEILGNISKVQELKQKLERAQLLRKHESNIKDSVLLTQTDSKGFSRPFNKPDVDNNQKRKKVNTHEEGKRQKYFADDDQYSLKQMFENEKFSNTRQDEEFLSLASKLSKNEDLDDIFVDKIRNEKSSNRERDKAIQEHQRLSKSLDNCQQCIQSAATLKHLIVSFGETIYLSLPQHEPLTDFHCVLVPIRHVSCATQLDENEWTEMCEFRKSLTNMFLARDHDVVFYETVFNANSYTHMVLNCVPVPKEQGDMAPIYFKKAIDESETEWSTNKKLVDLSKRDVRKAIPKGLPYFFVSFGMDEGFAHVIEDQRYFPKYFAAEVIGGMLDLHHSKWRKPRNQKFEEQKCRVLQFSDLWKQFDCTKK